MPGDLEEELNEQMAVCIEFKAGLGGDEFVVLAITGTDCNVSGIRDRIDRVTKRYNENAGKPYPIAMSTGIYKFKCSSDIDIYEILDKADRLLYEEKTRKKEQFGSYR